MISAHLPEHNLYSAGGAAVTKWKVVLAAGNQGLRPGPSLEQISAGCDKAAGVRSDKEPRAARQTGLWYRGPAAHKYLPFP